MRPNTAKGMAGASFKSEFREKSERNQRVLESWNGPICFESHVCQLLELSLKASLLRVLPHAQWPARPPPSAAHSAAAGPGQHVWRQHHRQGGVWGCFQKSCPALWGRAGCYRGEEEGEPRCGALADHCRSRWDSVQAPSTVSPLVPLPFAVCSFSLWKLTKLYQLSAEMIKNPRGGEDLIHFPAFCHFPCLAKGSKMAKSGSVTTGRFFSLGCWVNLILIFQCFCNI